MKDKIRVVLVDPLEESRGSLQRLLSGLDSIWLAESCETYPGASKAIDEQSPELALISLDADPERAVALIAELHRLHPRMALLPASRRHEGDLILRVMRAGAREFLTLPADPQDFISAVSRLVEPAEDRPGARFGGQIISLTGATGGVGCTSLAVNLATALAKRPQSGVTIADFDLLMGAVDACLDIVPDYTLLEVCQAADRLDLPLLKRSITRHSSGLYVLPRPIMLEDAARIDPEALRKVLSLLKAAFNTVVIDTSKALQATDFVAFEMSDSILLVVQLELTCLRNTARLLQLLRQVDGLIDRVKVVVNRSGFRDCEISPKKAEETLNLPIAWEIPNSAREFGAARSRGVPLEMAAPGCKALKLIAEIARATAPEPAQAVAQVKTRSGWFAASFL